MAEERHEHHELEEEVGQAVGPGAPGPEARDAAGASLSEALRVSFRLLTFIMIGVAVAFLLSGLSFVDPYEVGLKRVFGQIVGQVDEGLAYTWPFPVGEIDTVPMQNREMIVEEFWLHETPTDKAKPLRERRPGGEGLSPGRDGYLVTGDRNLLHLKLTVTYAVSRPMQYRMGASDPEALLRSELCNAAIHEAGLRTAEGLQGEGKNLQQFVEQVKLRAQDKIDELDVGIRIVRIDVGNNITWPLAALPAFDAVTRARTHADQLREGAERDATSTLRSAAGANFEQLIGDLDYVTRGAAILAGGEDPDEPAAPPRPEPTSPPADGEFDLIGQYQEAREQGDEQREQELLREIYAVLTSPRTGGEASGVIEQARAEREETIQDVRARAERFEKLLPAFRDPATSWQLVQREWFQTRDKVLGQAMFEIIDVKPGEKIIWRIGQDPGIAGQIRLEQLRRQDEQRRQEQE